jgi:hypothetical protein
MFLFTWVFDKLGYMPKISIDTNWDYSTIEKENVTSDIKQPVAKKATKVAKKTTSVKIPQATTRKTPKK